MDPTVYPHDTSCTWVIQADEGSVIRLSFLSFTVEKCGDGCNCDYVEVYDNNTALQQGGGLMGRYRV